MSHLAWLLYPVGFLSHLFRLGTPGSAIARDSTRIPAVGWDAARRLIGDKARTELRSQALPAEEASGAELSLRDEMMLDLP
jgi:hypothetical protein